MSYHKEKASKGHDAFIEGDYSKSIDYFKIAIEHCPGNSIYHSSRAKSYYYHIIVAKNPSENWKKIESDCKLALKYDSNNHEAMYYLALYTFEYMGKTALGMEEILLAYQKSIVYTKNSKRYTLPQEIYQKVLQLRKAVMYEEIDVKILEARPLFCKLVRLLEEEYEKDLASSPQKGRRTDLQYNETKRSLLHNKDLQTLRKIFSNSFNHANLKKKVQPPDHLCDPISLNLFHDPVISPSGHSYERSWLFQHLEIKENDPLTRQKITKAQCYPNLYLKKCVDEYLVSVGKGVDL